jgi:DNA modification methylase
MKDRIADLVRVKAGDLVANPSNWRRHPERQRKALRAFLEQLGFAAPLIARREAGDLVLIDGHLRASLDPNQVVPVALLDVTAEEADLLLTSLDPISAMAKADPEALHALLSRVSASGEVIDDFLEELRHQAEARGPSSSDREDIPQVAPARVSPGELYLLGEHRLLCGDARNSRDLSRLMGDKRADLLVTDPPYGLGYRGKTPRALTITGDSPADTPELLRSSFANVAEVLSVGASIYVFSPAGASQLAFLEAIERAGWEILQGLVWHKGTIVMGHQAYHYAHEPIMFARSPGGGPRGRGKAGWYGGNDQSSVIEVPKPARSSLHPTAKPVELMRRLISNSSRRAQVVLDCFAGSGSALIACELLSRRCLSMEIDPTYCDVIVSRYETLSGRRAEKEVSR